MMYRTNELFDLKHTQAAEYLRHFEYPWEALNGINEFIIGLGKNLGDDYKRVSENIWIHETADIDAGSYIGWPCIIGANTKIGKSVSIRGGVLIGENCVIGNSVELKNAILFDNVQIPDYNCLGDSILGFKAQMGSGVVVSNFKGDHSLIKVKNISDGEVIDTGLTNVGAMIGDFVEVGFNSALNPGTVVGRNTNICPLCIVRDIVPENSIFKHLGNIVQKENTETDDILRLVKKV